jgi:hypothetical protein
VDFVSDSAFFKIGYLAVELPKLNGMVINKPLCLFHGLGIVCTDQWNGFEEMAIVVDFVRAVFWHVVLLGSGGSMQHSLAPIAAENGAVMGRA